MNQEPVLPPAGWYPDTLMADTVRYWDGREWTDKLAPAAPVAPVSPPAMPPGRPCPYCFNGMPEHATRCASCGGHLRFCIRCQQNVGTWTRQKWVGMARGGTKAQYRCNQCNYVVEGPRW